MEQRRQRRPAGDPRLSPKGREILRRLVGGDLTGEFQAALDAVSALGSLLSPTTRAERADSRGQRRRDIDDVLSRINELLGQQVAEAAG